MLEHSKTAHTGAAQAGPAARTAPRGRRTSHVRRIAAAFACLCAVAALGPAAHVGLADVPAVVEPAPTDVPAEPPAPEQPEIPQEGEPTPPEGGETGGETPETPTDTPTISVPIVVASRADIPALAPGQQAQVHVTIQNVGDVAALAPVASFAPSSGLVIVGGSTSFVLPDIEAHGSQSVTVTVEALADVAGTAQNLSVETKFSYEGASGIAQTSSLDTLPIPTVGVEVPVDPEIGGGDSGADWGGGFEEPAPVVAQPVPNIIVTSFRFGDGSGAVAAGSEFPLSFTFTNTSSALATENLVVSVNTGDQFTINGGTNTFYHASLGPGGSLEQTLNLKAIVSERAVPGALAISFKYEYVEQDVRKQASTEVTLTVPVYQPDRFELETPALPMDAMVGMESTVTLQYVNKGRSAVGNLTASISGDGIQSMVPVQNLGNVEAGKSGVIGFVFTPLTSGLVDVALTVEYENANGEAVVKSFPLQVNVTDMAALYPDDLAFPVEPLPDETAPGFPLPAIVAIAAGVLLLTIVLALVVRRRLRKRKSSRADADWSYDDILPPITRGPAHDAPTNSGTSDRARGAHSKG